jgi:hypothetical protein
MNTNSKINEPLIEVNSLSLKIKDKKIVDGLSFALNAPSSCHICCDNEQLARAIYQALAFEKGIEKGEYRVTANVCRMITKRKELMGILTVKQNFDFFFGLYKNTIKQELTISDFQEMLELTNKQWGNRLEELTNTLIEKTSIAISFLIPFQLYIFRHDTFARQNLSENMKIFVSNKLAITGHICVFSKVIDDSILPKPSLRLMISKNKTCERYE